MTKIFDFYIESVNLKIARKFRFSRSKELVQKSVNLLLDFKIKNDLQSIIYEDADNILSEFTHKMNLQINLLGELISEGILSKDIYEDQKECIFITYERLEDHFIVSNLLNEISGDKIQQEFLEDGRFYQFITENNSRWLNKRIIDVFSIQIPEKFSFELFELVGDKKEEYFIVDAFIKSLYWRTNNSFVYDKVIGYINSVVFKNGYYRDFWDMLISVSVNPNHPLNALQTHKILTSKTMPDRDRFWNELLNDLYGYDLSVGNLIDWAWHVDNKEYASDECIKLASIMLSWFLISTNRKIRDTSTKALISLLQNRIHVLLELLQKFEDIDDPYIYERLYCVAYGCTLRTDNFSSLTDLSEYIYSTIFDQEEVYPHVLLRDYARGVIEYTLDKGIELNIDIEKIRPPYKSSFPTIPMDKEIEQLKQQLLQNTSEEEQRAIRKIFRSMEVEYDRTGKAKGYGDFGRYVFQSNFQDWKQLIPMDLKNIALKRIFELGYDAKKHAEFDAVDHNQYRMVHANERIGKKYQWIAMHELLAQVSDKYQLTAPWTWGDEAELFDFTGPWEPMIRDIDPTTINKPFEEELINIPIAHKTDMFDCSDEEWLHNFGNIPDPKNFMEANSEEWIILGGYFDFTEESKMGYDDFQLPQKHCFYIIKSYFVKKSDYAQIKNNLKEKSFIGDWMPKISERYQLFNREYCWSPAFNFFKRDYYEGNEIQKITDRYSGEELGEVIPTAEHYLWETQYDYSKEDAIGYKKPCSLLMDKLRLTYKNNDSYMYVDTESGKDLFCFDSSEGTSNDSILYAKKKKLLEFLETNDYEIIWTICGEKNIVGGKENDYNYSDWFEFSGLYTLENGVFSGELEAFPRPKPLPLNNNDFKDIVKKRNLYIDKTEYLYNLINKGKYYFVTRPDGFGKTLTVSTLYYLFKGEKELFKDTWIYGKWEWKDNLVIRLDMRDECFDYSNAENLELSLYRKIQTLYEEFDLEINTENYKRAFSNLFQQLYEKYNKRVVVLIDDVDYWYRDFLNNLSGTIDNPFTESEKKKLSEISFIINQFYSTIKDADAYTDFVFVTGVLNPNLADSLDNVSDISYNAEYAEMFGFTKDEFNKHFFEHIKDKANQLAKTRSGLKASITHNFYGYSFDGLNKVYSPFLILNFFVNHTLSRKADNNFLPEFAVKYLIENREEAENINEKYLPEHFRCIYGFENEPIDSLLLQCGYFTFKDIDKQIGYLIGHPNKTMRKIEQYVNSDSSRDELEEILQNILKYSPKHIKSEVYEKALKEIEPKDATE